MNTDSMVFVFGSNEGGHHGAGAARYAYMKRGATMGVGFGHTILTSRLYNTDRHAFAIPTKDRFIKRTLTLVEIQIYVWAFGQYVLSRPDLDFQVTCIGCGLAGLKHSDVAPLFNEFDKLPNVFFDELWKPYLSDKAKFWGTFG